LQFQTSPENADQVQVWSGTYVLPTGWLDTKLALYGIGISSNTQLGVNIGGMSVVGAGNIYGARLVKPLLSTDSFTQSFSGGLDYKEFGQGVNFLNSSSTNNTSINYLSFMTGYDGTWRGDSKLATLGVAAHYSFQGLANDQVEFTSKRAGATPDFVYLTSNLKYQQSLPKDIRVQLRAEGQVSSGKLVSNEQFSAGGPLSVRGYHQTQLLGDNGVALSMELHSPKLVNKEIDSVQNLRVFSFVDWANIWTYQPIAPTPSSSQLASTGVGLRMLLLKHFTGEFDWSYPMNKQSTIDVGQQRVDLRVAYDF
jgi:hemolysin activation/secretion protein